MGLHELKIFFSVKINDILMATQNGIWFEILMQEFDTLFDYNFQEGPKNKSPQY